MSEIPLYPDQCRHRETPSRCWQCLTVEVGQARTKAFEEAKKLCEETQKAFAGGSSHANGARHGASDVWTRINLLLEKS